MWIPFMRLTGSFSVVFNYMFSKEDFTLTCKHLVYGKYQMIGQQPGTILIQRVHYNIKNKQ